MSNGGGVGGHLAYGTRGLAKLIQSLGSDAALTRASLTSLNGNSPAFTVPTPVSNANTPF